MAPRAITAAAFSTCVIYSVGVEPPGGSHPATGEQMEADWMNISVLDLSIMSMHWINPNVPCSLLFLPNVVFVVTKGAFPVPVCFVFLFCPRLFQCVDGGGEQGRRWIKR